MGCSPSKGQIFAGLSKQAMHFGLHENSNDSLSGGTEIQQAETETFSTGQMSLEEENTLAPLCGKGFPLSNMQCDTATIMRESVDAEGNADLQGGLVTPKSKKEKTTREERKTKAKVVGGKNSLRKTIHIMSKEDCSETIVRAQHAAFAYLNPNILKYESLLELLNQATQTRLSLQPVVTLLALRYDEINCTLEEMAVEGEKMLEEYGNHVTQPPAPRDVPLTSGRPGADPCSGDPPLYLLQQMLQHSTEKMRLVGDSVKGLGDTALEEAAGYFMSLSRLLEHKLAAKRAAEGRVKQVLARVETAALRKSSPEDGTLHSEDSGIGADNECQGGSMRLHHHRGSLGSRASTGSSSGFPESRTSDRPQFDRVEEGRGDGDGDDDDDDDDDEDDSGDDYDGNKKVNEDEDETKDEQERKNYVTGCKMSDWTKSQCPLQEGPQNGRAAKAIFERANQRERKIVRPKTTGSLLVARQEKHHPSHLMGLWRSQSIDCLCSTVEDCMMNGQEKSQKDEEKFMRLSKGLSGDMVLPSLCRGSLRTHSSGTQRAARSWAHQYGRKGTLKTSIAPSSPLTFKPAPPGKNAVQQLISTFSQGVEAKSNQDNRLMKIKATRNCFMQKLTNSVEGVSVKNKNNSYSINERLSNRPDDIDVDSLPPPPPELLMDSNCVSKEDPACDEKDRKTLHNWCAPQRHRVSQRLRASLNTVTVLPSRTSLSQGSVRIPATCSTRQDAMAGVQSGQDCYQQAGLNVDKEEAASLNQHSRKIINLQHSSDSPDKKEPCDHGSFRHVAVKKGTAERQGSRAPTTPLDSRVRLPPSQSQVLHGVPRPPAPFTPSCPVSEKGEPSTTPPVQRCTMGNSDEGAVTPSPSSSSFKDARSVFCQKTHSGPQSQTPCCRSTLPRPWGEPCRRTTQVAGLAQAFMRSSLSGHLTSVIDQEQLLPNAIHTQDTEPINNQ